MEQLQEFIDLVEQLPLGLHSDWEHTNHYELTCFVKGEYWWLTLSDLFRDDLDCKSEEGQRVGLLMDVAAKAREILPLLKTLRMPTEPAQAESKTESDSTPK